MCLHLKHFMKPCQTALFLLTFLSSMENAVAGSKALKARTKASKKYLQTVAVDSQDNDGDKNFSPLLPDITSETHHEDDNYTSRGEKETLRMVTTKHQKKSEDSWRFIAIADLHTMTWFSWADPAQNRGNKAYNEQVNVLTHIHEKYGGELVFMPGDAVSYGNLSLDKIIKLLGGDLSQGEAVYRAGVNCYNTTRELFKDSGYDTLLATVGDHELGGNEGFRVSPSRSKMHTIPQARQAFGDGFNRNHDNGFVFDQPWFDGDIASRPLGTPYENTTFAYVHKNALFVTVDAFEIIGEGNHDFIDRGHGLGGEGAVTCTVDGNGEHLSWFENILRKGRDDASIRHILVQAHLPIIQPVQRVHCSGQFLDYGEESDFWNLMNEYGVDIYFAGEVHANTVTKSRYEGSNLVQIVSRGNSYNNFLTVDVSEDVLDIKIYNEFGDQRKFNAQYAESGHLTIDKSSAVTALSSSGMLELLDMDAPILIYDFEAILPLGTRQVPGFRSSDSLMATEVDIRGKLCTKSMLNLGGFGAQYDAQLGNIALSKGKDGGRAGYFTAKSRMAMIGTGPFSAGQAISFGLWFKTWKSDRKMVMVHYANYWGDDVPDTHEKDHFTLALDHGIPVVHTRPITALRSSDQKQLADGQWHHIAVSMPKNSCSVSEVEIYVDGIKVSTTITNDRRIFQTTSGRMSLGGYGYSNVGFEDAYPGSGPYIGKLDDFALFARPLNINVDFLDSIPSISNSPTEFPTVMNGAPCVENSKMRSGCDTDDSIQSISNSPTEFPFVLNGAPCVETSKKMSGCDTDSTLEPIHIGDVDNLDDTASGTISPSASEVVWGLVLFTLMAWHNF